MGALRWKQSIRRSKKHEPAIAWDIESHVPAILVATLALLAPIGGCLAVCLTCFSTNPSARAELIIVLVLFNRYQLFINNLYPNRS